MIFREKVLFYIVICIVSLSIPSCFSNQGTDEHMKTIISDFGKYAEQARQDWQIPGMSVAIVVGDDIVYAKGFGVRDTTGEPVTRDTIFSIASLTKSFSAALLGMQVDEGKFSWGTKILQLFPEFKLFDSVATQEFEVRDLIAHDSGLPPDAEDNLGNFGYSVEHTISVMRFIKPISAFRSEFAYQDVFLEVAKKIIEKCSSKDYTSVLHSNLFAPLEMNRSYVRTENFDKIQNVAQPYLYYLGKVLPYPKDFPYLSEKWALELGVAGGGIKSSVVDMANWLILNMNNGVWRGKQLISTQQMNYIHDPKTPIVRSKTGDIEVAYSEGWFYDKQEYEPYTVIYHAGGETGMHSLMAYIPERKVGIVILTNQYTNKVPEALFRVFFDMYFGKPFKDWSKIYLKDRETVMHKKSSLDYSVCNKRVTIDLDPYVGTYYNDVYGDLLMSKVQDHLVLTIGPQKFKWDLTPCSNNVFKAYWPNPGGMDVLMIPKEQDLVKFRGDGYSINGMYIDYLNDDGSGDFIKK